MTFLIGGFRLTNFGDFRLTVFGQFNPTLTTLDNPNLIAEIMIAKNIGNLLGIKQHDI